LLAVYTIVILLLSPVGLEGDEGRYLTLSAALAHGHYVAPGSERLASGPGYPLALAPLALAHLLPSAGRLLNALLLFLAVYYVYLTLELYLSRRFALAVA